jgi:hypothetical protein
VAQPYEEFARTLDKTAGALDQAATGLAEQAGYRAVTRDSAGNVQVQQFPIVGDAAIAFHRAVKTAALADGEGAMKRDEIALRQQFRDNPDGYQTAAEHYKQEKVAQYTQIAGADVGLALGRTIDATTTMTYRGLLNEHERLQLQRADRSMEAGIMSARDDLVAMARGGVTSGPAWDSAMAKVQTLTNERVNNPRLAYPPEQAAYDMQHLQGELKANGFMNVIDQIYKNPDPEKGGARAALQAAQSILTDTSVKLTESERQAYYHKAIGEVHANESLRRQDLYENHAAANELRTASSLGLRIEPERIDEVARQFYNLNDPGSAARLYAWAARAPLNDDFGRQPLQAQTQQLATLQGPASIRNNNPGAQWPGTVATIYGATGSENIAGGNKIATFPTPVHGAAAMFALADTRYAGMPLRDAIAKWSGGNNVPEYVDSVTKATGLSPDTVVTGQLLRGPTGIALAKAMSRVEAGREFPMSDAQWQQAQAAAFGIGPAGQRAGLPPPGLEPNPAASLWLQSNRQRQVQSEARRDWTATIGEWTKNGTEPNRDAVMTIVNAARATGDSDLLDQIGNDMERVQFVQQAAQGPLAGQEAQIADLRRRAAGGELAPGQAALEQQLQRRYEAINTGLKDNPIATTAANFPETVRVPAPLNPTSPDEFRAGLALRARIAQFAQQNWGTRALPALDKADATALQATLDRSDPATKARIYGDMTAALPDERIRNATFAKLGEGGPKAMSEAFAGALYAQSPEVASSILRGQAAIHADQRNDPSHEGAGSRQTFLDELDRRMPQTAFSLEGRTDPNGSYATMRGAVVARYADLTAQDPAGRKEFSADRLQRAVDDVTGGILDHNGMKFIAPARGMSQANFDRVLFGLNDQDLAGVTTLAGEPVTAAYLQRTARLESYGNGQYRVQLGSDPERPIYAVTGANTELPRPFVLDLRGRQPGPPLPFRAPPNYSPGG